MYDEKTLRLIIARLSAKSPNVSIAIVGKGTFNRDEMINQVKEHTKIGEAIVKRELEFIRDMPRLSIILSEEDE